MNPNVTLHELAQNDEQVLDALRQLNNGMSRQHDYFLAEQKVLTRVKRVSWSYLPGLITASVILPLLQYWRLAMIVTSVGIVLYLAYVFAELVFFVNPIRKDALNVHEDMLRILGETTSEETPKREQA